MKIDSFEAMDSLDLENSQEHINQQASLTQENQNLHVGIEALRNLQQKVFDIKEHISKVVVGQDDLVDYLLVCLFIEGHILLEGVPGIAKTLVSKLFSSCVDAEFSRIQFTPDLMPADIIGTNVFNVKQNEFEFKKGPIFSNIILIDEINRAPAKTQSALFEVMQEKQITSDGTEYKMAFPFMTIATQNPIESEGTYKLPEAQLDRFVFKYILEHPSFEVEKEILMRFRNDFKVDSSYEHKVILKKDELKNLRKTIENIQIKEDLIDYIARIVSDTRNSPDIFLGASPRASINIMKSSKAFAALNGRDFVTPDDIRKVSEPVLNHRVILSPEREMEGVKTSQIIRELIAKIEVPR